MRTSLIPAALACILAASNLAAQADTSWLTLQAAFRQYVAADSVVGASFLVMRDGAVLRRDNVGMGDRARAEPVTDASIFHWGSITKTLTAVAIMQLRDRGKLTLDDKITRYIPELRQVHDRFGSMDDITLRMLLSHSSGLRNGTWPWTEGSNWEPFEPTRWEQLVSMMPYQQLLFAPGSQFGYSNPAFIYLARVIEQITGDPWIHYIQKNIWTPLGLSQSYVNATPYHLERDRSNNYYVRRDSVSGALAVTANGRDFDPGITIPNGGWNAPLGDLATWATFLTDATGGDARKRRAYDTILSRKSLEEMWTAVVPLSAATPATGAMGLSFFLYPRGTERIIGHTGSQAAFRAFLYFNPRTRRVVIAAYNTSSLTELTGAKAAQQQLNDAVFRYLEKSP
ncbi:MAG TPA: serine hydrolase domain-containing protein [Gemmatimonadaceae bacterium]|nr:serine hydrolase domain-containing protein [Gemmatimonadaceae bacterium]